MATATANANAPAKTTTGLTIKANPQVTAFKHLLESPSVQQSLRSAAAKHIDPKRLIRVVLGVMMQNRDLASCTPESVLVSLLRAAAVGLEPDGGALGQAYLVPFGRECTLIIGYRGMVKLARNSGDVADVWAEVVYQHDQFDYEFGLNPTLKHKRNDDVADPGELKYVYAVARFRDGERKFVVLNKADITKIRGVSRSSGNSSSPWQQWPAEMWKKSAVRRLCKLLPLSVESKDAMSHDEEHEGSKSVIDVPEIPLLNQAEDAETEQPPEFAEAYAHCTTEAACDEVFADLKRDDPTLEMNYAAARDWKKANL